MNSSECTNHWHDNPDPNRFCEGCGAQTPTMMIDSLDAALSEPPCSCPWEIALWDALRASVRLARADQMGGVEVDSLISVRATLRGYEDARRLAEA